MNKIVLSLLFCTALVFSQSKKVFIPYFRAAAAAKIDRPTCGTISGLFSSKLKEQTEWDVFTEDDVSSMLEQEDRKKLVDCTEGSCMQEIAGAIGAPYLISGDIAVVGGQTILNVTLIDIRGGKAIGKASEMGTMDQIIKKFDLLAAKVAGVPLKRTDIPVKSSGAGSMTVSETTNVEQGKNTSVVSSGAVIIKFESDPAGASVSVDGMPMGKTTPFQKSFPMGSHRVIMALDEYKLSASDITFSSNGQTVTAKMVPTYGFLTVNSTPDGIPVQLDGSPIGSTPIASRRVSEGGHELILGDDCWLKATSSINIESGVARTINQTMNSRTAGISVTAIDAITGDDLIAKILDENGKILGETPFSGTVPLCTRSITVDASGYSQSKPVLSLVEGSVASISAKMQKGGSSKYGMKLIPAGTYQMGSTNGEDDEKPVHSVTVSSFYMDSTEVTQWEYSRLMGTKPWNNCSGEYCTDENPTHPANYVTWFDAIKYCNARSREAGLTPVYNESTGACNFSANGYRLPTEAEFEYANRAGTTTKFVWGDYDDGGCTYSNGADQSAKRKWSSWTTSNCDDGYAMIAPVAQFNRNSYGLYDMTGNVWEWCNDWMGSYGSGSQTDPRGASTGSYRVSRGGGGYGAPANLRSANRYYSDPTDVDYGLGFRCVSPR